MIKECCCLNRSYYMVKNNVLIMCAFAMGLSLGAEVIAGKPERHPQVECGPMDKFVTRKKPKVVFTPNSNQQKPQKMEIDPAIREAILLHNGLYNSNFTGLSARQKAY